MRGALRKQKIPESMKRIESHLGRLEDPLHEVMQNKKKTNRALITAANKGDLRKVRELIEEGAERSHRNNVGMRAIDCARFNDYIRVVEFLEEKPNQKLFEAIRKNNFEMFSNAMEEGANPNAVIEEKMSALNTAIGFQRRDMMKSLVEKGADVNEMSMHGHTPLMMAVLVDDLKTVKYLVEKGANPDEENMHAVSAKSLAESQGYNSIVRYFTDKKTEKADM